MPGLSRSLASPGQGPIEPEQNQKPDVTEEIKSLYRAISTADRHTTEWQGLWEKWQRSPIGRVRVLYYKSLKVSSHGHIDSQIPQQEAGVGVGWGAECVTYNQYHLMQTQFPREKSGLMEVCPLESHRKCFQCGICQNLEKEGLLQGLWPDNRQVWMLMTHSSSELISMPVWSYSCFVLQEMHTVSQPGYLFVPHAYNHLWGRMRKEEGTVFVCLFVSSISICNASCVHSTKHPVLSTLLSIWYYSYLRKYSCLCLRSFVKFL